MFAVAVDLTVKETAKHHPNGCPPPTRRLGPLWQSIGSDGVQGSIHVYENEDMSNLMDAMDALTDLPWFPSSVLGIRALRVEQWSDFTDRVKRLGRSK